MLVKEGKNTYTVSVKNGNKYWYRNNRLHREMGPAIELENGKGIWYHEGKKIEAKDQKEFEKIVEASKEQYYTIKVEALVPATLTYKILAKTPEDAIQKIKKTKPINTQYKPNIKNLKATVYEFGTLMIRLVMSLVGK